MGTLISVPPEKVQGTMVTGRTRKAYLRLMDDWGHHPNTVQWKDEQLANGRKLVETVMALNQDTRSGRKIIRMLAKVSRVMDTRNYDAANNFALLCIYACSSSQDKGTVNARTRIMQKKIVYYTTPIDFEGRYTFYPERILREIVKFAENFKGSKRRFGKALSESFETGYYSAARDMLREYCEKKEGT
jgi:UDP-N-acetylmuramate-alanine ligase